MSKCKETEHIWICQHLSHHKWHIVWMAWPAVSMHAHVLNVQESLYICRCKWHTPFTSMSCSDRCLLHALIFRLNSRHFNTRWHKSMYSVQSSDGHHLHPIHLKLIRHDKHHRPCHSKYCCTLVRLVYARTYVNICINARTSSGLQSQWRKRRKSLYLALRLSNLPLHTK